MTVGTGGGGGRCGGDGNGGVCPARRPRSTRCCRRRRRSSGLALRAPLASLAWRPSRPVAPAVRRRSAALAAAVVAGPAASSLRRLHASEWTGTWCASKPRKNPSTATTPPSNKTMTPRPAAAAGLPLWDG